MCKDFSLENFSTSCEVHLYSVWPWRFPAASSVLACIVAATCALKKNKAKNSVASLGHRVGQ